MLRVLGCGVGIVAVAGGAVAHSDAIRAATLIGLCPERLAVAGASASVADGILNRLMAEPSLRHQLDDAVESRDEVAERMTIHNQATGANSNSTATEEFAELVADYHIADEAVAQAVMALRSAAFVGLDPNFGARIAQIQEAVEDGLPCAFGALDLDALERADVARALRLEARLSRLNQSLRPEDVAVLQACRYSTSYTNAEYALTYTLPEIEAVWTLWAD